MLRSLKAYLAALALVVMAAPAFGQAIGQGFELERGGRYADAAAVYLTTLRTDPANLPALLGLERVLPVLSRLPELLPLVQRARERVPENGTLRALELRVYAGLNEPDSLEAAARRWAAVVPRSDAPYREWALALADRRMFDDARRVLLLGRRTLGGGATTLAIELAELEQRVENWEGAAREWGHAVAAAADMLPQATSQLSETPAAQRARVLAALTSSDAAPRTQRLGAELLLSWGQAVEAWRLFEQSIATGATSAPSGETATALRRFADLAGAVATPAGHRVRGLALSRWADLVPSPLAERARAEAVRELLDGGDRVGARAALERLAADSLAPADAKAMAEAALVEVLIADGQLDAAERRLAAEAGTLGGDDRARLRLQLARARVVRGELDRAAKLLSGDSSVAALAEQGWIALYRGDLRGATDAFRAAGPYAGERAAATERTAMLALVQQIPADTLPELGAALLTLARGDSAGAVTALRRVAANLEPGGGGGGGRSDVLLLAGQVAARLGGVANDATAIAVFDEIVRAGGPGAAPPAAELAWARVLVRQGRAADAVQRLEHLILSYPGSAFVPEARRELERARGAVPRS
jgi:tetratricopeptide (TPR) repeat protein